MSYIKYLTHKTSVRCLNNILNDGFKSKKVDDYADMFQCIWFNYIGIYKDNTFLSDMPTTASNIDIILCIDFNKLIELLKYEDGSYKFVDIGIYNGSLRYNIYSEYDEDKVYTEALNYINDETDLINGLMKLDNKDSVEKFEKMRDNWDKIVKEGQELVFFQNGNFKLDIKDCLSSIILLNHDQESNVREILDVNGLENVSIHKNWSKYYKDEVKKINLQKMCKNIKHYYNKRELEKIVKNYKITLGGRTKAEICMNLYLQLLMIM